jgi:WD40 repeat protein
VWTVASDAPAADLREHTQQIYMVKWNPAEPAMLATCVNATLPCPFVAHGAACRQLTGMEREMARASFDHSVRLWDANAAKRLHALVRHRGPVYAVEFSPDGKLVASGAFDSCVMVWSVKVRIRVTRARGAR